MGKVLTVVVPSYNTEQYMDDCIPTFLAEEILEDIEILLIDDGSKDGTAKKGMEYERKYPGVIKLISKENGGHGSTINKGIELATGKYFKVVDGDDWVDTEAFKNLVLYLKDNECDTVICNFFLVNNKTRKKAEVTFSGILFNRVYAFDNVCGKVGWMGIHSITIKTDILKDNKIHIDEHKFYVDLEYVIFPLPFVNTIVFLNEYVYMYRIGVATQSISIESKKKNLQQHNDVLFRLINFYNTTKENTSVQKQRYIAKRIAVMIKDHYKILLHFSKSDNVKKQIITFDLQVKNASKEIYNASTYKAIVNIAIIIFRKTNFILYPFAAFYLKMKEK